VRQREVVFAPEARDDLWRIYDLAYIERIETYCLGFDFASERGRLRDDIRPGLRIVGFERRVTVAFSVDDGRVTILRLFYGGRAWEDTFG